MQNNTKCMHGICIKIEFGSQRRERLLFLYTNMAAVTSRENDLFFSPTYTRYNKSLSGYIPQDVWECTTELQLE